MKKRPKTFGQVFNETWPNKAKSKQGQSYKYISRMQDQLAVYLPETWQNKIKIEKYQNGTLFVSLPSAAYKMRFNSIRLDILSHLRQSQPDLISIQEQVKPVQAAVTIEEKIKQKPTPVASHLSAQAKETLLNTASNLPENLQKAIIKLTNSD
jgi:hypothetical protein